ncbi:hypothetical protein ARMGADRAFT_671811 [Armillaria gallica]|uniref:Uncharacterized protein n=1 Tax=Armillaria gallica TaxID=47427 RepID=A0A2H3CNR5_ARMGA|nr:hypothetical protein ARMGADRAFT_671811 [Armillaria gallica]
MSDLTAAKVLAPRIRVREAKGLPVTDRSQGMPMLMAAQFTTIHAESFLCLIGFG